MKVDGKAMRTIWVEPDGATVGVIDQTRLPHRFETARWSSMEDAAHGIKAMIVRGAPSGSTQIVRIALSSTFMAAS